MRLVSWWPSTLPLERQTVQPRFSPQLQVQWWWLERIPAGHYQAWGYTAGLRHQVYGAQGLLDAYNQTFTIPGFGLSGPTNFVPILREAHDRAMEARQRLLATKKDQNKKQEYNVLVILTDGVISDMAKTVDKICEIAASTPLSIVIVGVGKANFDAMERLDGDDGNRLRNSQGRLAARDIVQFVPFRQCAGNADRLAAETLKEVPQQLVQYFQQLGIQPNPRIPVPDYTEEEIFLDNDFQDGEDIIVGEDEIQRERERGRETGCCSLCCCCLLFVFWLGVLC